MKDDEPKLSVRPYKVTIMVGDPRDPDFHVKGTKEIPITVLQPSIEALRQVAPECGFTIIET